MVDVVNVVEQPEISGYYCVRNSLKSGVLDPWIALQNIHTARLSKLCLTQRQTRLVDINHYVEFANMNEPLALVCRDLIHINNKLGWQAWATQQIIISPLYSNSSSTYHTHQLLHFSFNRMTSSFKPLEYPELATPLLDGSLSAEDGRPTSSSRRLTASVANEMNSIELNYPRPPSSRPMTQDTTLVSYVSVIPIDSSGSLRVKSL